MKIPKLNSQWISEYSVAVTGKLYSEALLELLFFFFKQLCVHHKNDWTSQQIEIESLIYLQIPPYLLLSVEIQNSHLPLVLTFMNF